MCMIIKRLLPVGVYQSSVSVKVDRETGNAGSALTVAGFDVQVNSSSDLTSYLYHLTPLARHTPLAPHTFVISHLYHSICSFTSPNRVDTMVTVTVFMRQVVNEYF